ncbi:hypothetical protein BMS3Abin15_00497 [bacterium BMS3Abin15]|nr:hypothetical protein BMS3Abin15_00497 [bacterium BMS3Abin15]HDZ85564.1 hypothetical protein [Candidatus Moranbacteria bacterium]
MENNQNHKNLSSNDKWSKKKTWSVLFGIIMAVPFIIIISQFIPMDSIDQYMEDHPKTEKTILGGVSLMVLYVGLRIMGYFKKQREFEDWIDKEAKKYKK